ncbi:hypothetical protein FBF83_10850 [Pseudalkalibacillus hwajinpoensis]|uniref:Uncharacterized protein n=1 Tax=Guptibacillus hwajinpoensis TaxID=208199 RepID=A0A4V5Q1C4_9BACL|nr:hypothetical protein FBF83_10850 [Pseudalkalibacillus hwajinpoensis]
MWKYYERIGPCFEIYNHSIQTYEKLVFESEQANELNREFHQDQQLNVVVSDLTYVRVGQK